MDILRLAYIQRKHTELHGSTVGELGYLRPPALRVLVRLFSDIENKSKVYLASWADFFVFVLIMYTPNNLLHPSTTLNSG